MKVEITNGFECGFPTFGFVWRDEDGRPLWRGRGFVKQETLDEAIEIARRALVGLPPREMNLAHVNSATAAIVAGWVGVRPLREAA